MKEKDVCSCNTWSFVELPGENIIAKECQMCGRILKQSAAKAQKD